MILTSPTIVDLITNGLPPLIENADPEQLEPGEMEGGQYDLRVIEVRRALKSEQGVLIGQTERRTLKTEEEPRVVFGRGSDNSGWELYFGHYYLIKTVEIINMPVTLRGIIEPRTTTFRSAAHLWLEEEERPLTHLLHGGVVPGYQGQLTFGLRLLLDVPFRLEFKARVASIAFAEMEAEEPCGYSGVWQGGRVSTEGQKERGF